VEREAGPTLIAELAGRAAPIGGIDQTPPATSVQSSAPPATARLVGGSPVGSSAIAGRAGAAGGAGAVSRGGAGRALVRPLRGSRASGCARLPGRFLQGFERASAVGPSRPIEIAARAPVRLS
jgi:hypothetical protein